MRAFLLALCLLLPASAQERFLLLPLDNRPCNVLFARQLARIAGAEVATPPNHWLGSFLNPGLCTRFPPWLEENVRPGDTVLVSSDMLCYGGLVASRNVATSELQATLRLEALRGLKARGVRVEVLATVPRLSLRTSEGQAPYEQKLAAWAAQPDSDPDVPAYWVTEYLGVRERNRKILLALVEMVGKGAIDRLVVGQDDSAGKGLHYLDQQQIRERVESLHLNDRVTLLSGADELTMDMICGRLADIYDVHPRLGLEYSEAGSERRIPPMESHPLETMVLQHLELCGARRASEEEDVRLFIQVPAAKPFALPGPDRRPKSYLFVERVREWLVQQHPAAIADLAYINRMDPFLAEAVLKRVPLTRLEGFAAWNTPANAFGTVVAQVVLRRIAEQRAVRWPIADVKESARTHLAFLLARLIDDYGYQTMVRAEYYAQARGLSPNPDPLLSPYLTLGRKVRVQLIGWAEELYASRFRGRMVELPGGRGPARLGDAKLEVVLPWPRLFEVEVRLDLDLQPVKAPKPD